MIAEGEKAASAIQQAGYIAASYIGGAKNAARADYSPVAGLPVILWPDDDAEGRAAAAAAGRMALGAGAVSVRMMDAPGETKQDAADYPADVRAEMISAALGLPEWTPPPEKPPAQPAGGGGNRPAPPKTGDSGKYDPLAVGWNELHDMDLAGKLLHWHGERLVVAEDSAIKKPRDPVLYVVTQTGKLTANDAPLRGLMADTADRYILLASESGLSDKEFVAVVRHARKLKDAATIDTIRRMALSAAYLYPTDCEIAKLDDVDADLSVIGTPHGVFDIRALTYLPPAEARRRLVTATTPYDYKPNTGHHLIEKIYPVQPDDENLIYELNQLGFDLTHPPRRHFVAHIAAGGTGKTTRKNLISAALGYDYSKSIRPAALKDAGDFEGPSSHNGELLMFAAPTRIVWCSEASRLDAEGVNYVTGGERRIEAREIREKVQTFFPTATLYVQANMPANGGQILGLDSDNGNDAADALQKRIRAVVFDGIADPDERIRDHAPEDPAAMRHLFSMLMRYAHAQVDALAPPAPPAGVVASKERLIDAETADWKTDLIPDVFRFQRDTDGMEEVVANSHDAYMQYLDWHELSHALGKPKPKKVFTEALKQHYGDHNTKRAKLPRRVKDKEGRVDSVVWLGLMMTNPPAT